MPIENKTWVTGEVITADDLNLITPFFITSSLNGAGDGMVLDKKWQEINDAFITGKRCYIVSREEEENTTFVTVIQNVLAVGYRDGDYFVDINADENYTCETEDDYPLHVMIGIG